MTIKVRSSSLRSSSRQSTSPAGLLTTVLFGERKGAKALVGKVFFQSVLGGSLLRVPLVDCQQLES